MRSGKKLMAGVLTVAMGAALLTGCSGSGSQKAASDGSTQLNMWVHETDSNEGQLYKALIEEFNAAHEGKITVTLTQIPRNGDAGGYDDKINAAITTGNMPDVFTVDGPTVAANAESGVILPIDQYFTEEDKKDFNPDIIEQGTYKGQLYTVAAMDSSVLLFYNKDLFEAAGITAASAENPWTWDELYDAAKKLTTSDVYGLNLGNLGTLDEWITFAFLPMVQSAGGNIISEDGTTVDGYLNGQPVKDAVTYMKKLVDDGVVSAIPEDKQFESGKAAMILSGSWAPSGFRDYPELDWGAMPYPVCKEGAAAYSPCGSWCFAMSKDCKEENRDAAGELLQFLSSKDSCKRMYEANSMPPARQSATAEIAEFGEEPLSVMAYQLQNTASARPRTENYPILSNQFQKAVANSINGSDVDKELKDAVDQYTFQVGN